MRLGQLARQLAIKPDEIVRFLASHQITVELGNNTRLEDGHAEMIIQQFAPLNELLQAEITEEPDHSPGDLPIIENELPQAGTEETVPTEIPETIKAPKVELAGLKVLGKIDLPEKKVIELVKEDEGTPPPAAQPRRSFRPNTPSKSWKNPLALEREREEREKKEKLRQQREQDKKRRTEFYKKRLKPQAPTTRVRIIEEEVIEMPQLEPERPKTWWGRFILWLNT